MKRILNLFLLPLIATLGCLFFSYKVNATETKNNPTIQVTPLIEELALNPAAEITKSFSVTNQSDKEQNIRVYTAPYSVSKKSNTSDFESQSEYTQIYHWINIIGQNQKEQNEAVFSIKPKQTETIKYHIKVPESAPGGSQHASIFVETVPEDAAETTSITTVARAAIKIFADISGETIKDAEITTLNSSSVFTINSKVFAETTVKNIGNVDIKPTLTLKISTLNGETIYEKSDVAMIFPENDGKIKIEWPETPAFGIYKMIASTNILGKRATTEKTIIILPAWFIVLILFLIIVVIVIMIRKNNHKKIRAKRSNNTSQQ